MSKGSVPENTIFILTVGATQRQFLRMARKLRVQHPGAIYHVMSRGNRRERIFVDDQDRRKFLQSLSEACQKTGWIPRDSAAGRREFERQMEERRRWDDAEGIKKMRRGWYLGDEQFSA